MKRMICCMLSIMLILVFSLYSLAEGDTRVCFQMLGDAVSSGSGCISRRFSEGLLVASRGKATQKCSLRRRKCASGILETHSNELVFIQPDSVDEIVLEVSEGIDILETDNMIDLSDNSSEDNTIGISVVSNSEKVKLNITKATLYVRKTLKLKVMGKKSKVTWSSSNKKIATVSQKGIVTAKKAGKVTITAKVGKKKLKCKITVLKPIEMKGYIWKSWAKVKNKFPDQFRLYESNEDYDYYTNDYVLIEVNTNYGKIISISLLTDATEGIGKYTLYGISPGVSREDAQYILEMKYDGEKQKYSGSFDEVYHLGKTGDVVYITYDNNDNVDLIIAE